MNHCSGTMPATPRPRRADQVLTGSSRYHARTIQGGKKNKKNRECNEEKSGIRKEWYQNCPLTRCPGQKRQVELTTAVSLRQSVCRPQVAWH